jgi:hypothetical protein
MASAEATIAAQKAKASNRVNSFAFIQFLLGFPLLNSREVILDFKI